MILLFEALKKLVMLKVFLAIQEETFQTGLSVRLLELIDLTKYAAKIKTTGFLIEMVW